MYTIQYRLNDENYDSVSVDAEYYLEGEVTPAGVSSTFIHFYKSNKKIASFNALTVVSILDDSVLKGIVKK